MHERRKQVEPLSPPPPSLVGFRHVRAVGASNGLALETFDRAPVDVSSDSEPLDDPWTTFTWAQLSRLAGFGVPSVPQVGNQATPATAGALDFAGRPLLNHNSRGTLYFGQSRYQTTPEHRRAVRELPTRDTWGTPRRRHRLFWRLWREFGLTALLIKENGYPRREVLYGYSNCCC